MRKIIFATIILCSVLFGFRQSNEETSGANECVGECARGNDPDCDCEPGVALCNISVGPGFH